MKTNRIGQIGRGRLASLAAFFLLVVGLLSTASATARAETVTVFAAASLKNALEEIAAGFTADIGVDVRFSFAGSSALARQIEQGAPAQIFISANSDWMDRLERDGFLVPESRFDLAGNRLVLVSGEAAGDRVEITPDFDLAGRLGNGRLAMGLIDAVPAGIYGKAALEHLGLWESVAARVAQSDNVRSALALVALGAAPFGIVYETDAIIEPRVHVVGLFPQDSHPPILYPAARIKGPQTASGAAFLAYLKGAEAQGLLEKHGFLPAKKAEPR